LEFDAGRGLVRVEPGILLSELNAYLADHGMRFAPDPGSQDLCRIGGMVGHNASGYRSVKYGQTRDHVQGLKVLLADGTSLDAHDVPLDGAEWRELIGRAECLERVRREMDAHRDAILSSRRPIRIEFEGGEPEPIAEVVVRRVATAYPLSRAAEIAFDPVRQSALWRVRRSVFPTIIQRPGPRKAWGFVENPIVPRDRVPEFMEFLVDLARRHGTIAGIYGHIGDGNTHYRPFFDPTDQQDFERMRALREEFDRALLDRFQ